MTRYFKNSIAAIAVILTTSMVSCVDSDGQFGNSHIPPEWEMVTSIDSTIMPQTHIFEYDSVVSSPYRYIFPGATAELSSNIRMVGSVIDPKVGRISSQIFTHIRPLGVGPDDYFGKNPVADSIKLVLDFSGYLGDTLTGTDFEVFEVTKTDIRANRMYYNIFDMAGKTADQPLAKFTLKSPARQVIKLPIETAQRFLINKPGISNPYYRDTTFHKFFKGLYFKTKDATSGEGCMYVMNLATSNMILYYHNDRDTLAVVRYPMFDISKLDLTPTNTNFTMSQFDHSFAKPAEGGVEIGAIGNTDIESKMCYIQGMGGLGTKITIPKDQLDAFVQKAKNKGYNKVAIHSAELIFTAENVDGENLNAMLSHISPYKSFTKLNFLSDYFATVLGSPKPTSDGFLMRSLGVYRVNITSHVQKLITGKTTEYVIELAPALEESMRLGRTIFMGSNSTHPPRMVLTYTMIK